MLAGGKCIVFDVQEESAVYGSLIVVFMLNYSWAHAGLWNIIKYVKLSNFNCSSHVYLQESLATVGSLASVFSDATGTDAIFYTVIIAERLESGLSFPQY